MSEYTINPKSSLGDQSTKKMRKKERKRFCRNHHIFPILELKPLNFLSVTIETGLNFFGI